jgi:hypothetical protein
MIILFIFFKCKNFSIHNMMKKISFHRKKCWIFKIYFPIRIFLISQNELFPAFKRWNFTILNFQIILYAVNKVFISITQFSRWNIIWNTLLYHPLHFYWKFNSIFKVQIKHSIEIRVIFSTNSKSEPCVFFHQLTVASNYALKRS